MILELDVGNTRIKWRLLAADSAEPVDEGHVPGFDELIRLPAFTSPIDFARMCSVRGGEINRQIEDWLQSNQGIEVARARVTQCCGGVTNQYADVSRLGIDRWLAMLGAYRRARGACLIIDSGTAFTLDAIDATGLHLGGYIIPGLQLMRQSIEANTAIRLSPDYATRSGALGHSTDEAVFNGTVAALLGTIELQSRRLREQEGASIYFAGGDAELLHALAEIDGSEVVRSLVFEGLAIACPRPGSVEGQG